MPRPRNNIFLSGMVQIPIDTPCHAAGDDTLELRMLAFEERIEKRMTDFCHDSRTELDRRMTEFLEISRTEIQRRFDENQASANNVNEPPILESGGYPAGLPLQESTKVGTEVFVLKGHDPEGSPVKYGIQLTDHFVVNSRTGVITLAKPLNRESEQSMPLAHMPFQMDFFPALHNTTPKGFAASEPVNCRVKSGVSNP
ncbi:Cadherin-87A [Dufourea novaeangliae]|uniref:Cadherin-87A n=1 Tax=Dufourea novaeangliae TaxID=178035 RepID=A0A154PRM6_DUFNO|nr:Cadherin-87A [Dufourea novaeangliae]